MKDDELFRNILARNHKAKLRKANPEKVLYYARKSNRKVNGISNPTGEIKSGQCEICKEEFVRLNLDHNHTTSSARGWLCSKCNTWLSKFENKYWVKNTPVRVRRPNARNDKS